MATSILPAINSGKSKQRMAQEQKSHGPKKIIFVQKQTRIEQEMHRKRLELRNKIPELNEWQTAEFKNNYKHNLCLEMLQQGFHKSFSELFGLIKYQSEERLRAGPDSVLWLQKPLNEEHEKLDLLKTYLVEAEKATLKNDYVKVYDCHHKLAQHFQGTGDKWLSDHFFFNCLQWSSYVSEDDGKIAADGHCNVGLSLEESGNYEEAANNFELFYSLTLERPDWTTEEGENMHSQSCNNLTRIYTMISDQHLSRNDPETCLNYLKQAYKMAQDGGDPKLLGEAGYRLGVAYERNRDPATALMYLESYLDSCTRLKDNGGIGKACEAIAKSLDSQGRIDESIKFLQRFIQVSEDSKDDQALSLACGSLGSRFNSMGYYDQAAEYFSRSYNLSRSLNDTKAIGKSRVLSGVAQAHKMLAKYNKHMEFSNWPCISRIIDWKDNRSEDIVKLDVPEPIVEIRESEIEETNEEGESNIHENEETEEKVEGNEDENALETKEMMSSEGNEQ